MEHDLDNTLNTIKMRFHNANCEFGYLSHSCFSSFFCGLPSEKIISDKFIVP